MLELDIQDIELISLDPFLQVAFTGTDADGQYVKRIEWFGHDGRGYVNVEDGVRVPHGHRLRELLDNLIVEFFIREANSEN